MVILYRNFFELRTVSRGQRRAADPRYNIQHTILLFISLENYD